MGGTVEDAKALKKEQRRKEKKDAREDPAVEVAEGEKSRKKKRKRDAEVGETDAREGGKIPESEGGSKPKKRKDVESTVDEATTSTKGTSDKRKKRKKEKPQVENLETPGSKSKKHKDEIGLLDPQEDAALDDQARKALTYAYAQFRHPSTWKFNKARQNWLIRNIWSEQAISETHVPLVTRYLASVQGGVRETLIKACNAIVSPPDPKPVDPAKPSPETTGDGPDPTSVPTTDGVKQARAQAILDVLVPATDV